MENPADSKDVIKAIYEAMQEHADALEKRMGGLGLSQRIYHKLTAEGFTIYKQTDKK